MEIRTAFEPPLEPRLERYRDEIDENDDYNQILAEAGSMQDVLNYAKSFENVWPHERATLNSLNRLGPKLNIRLILSLASSAGDTLRDVLDMLEEVSLTLPRFHGYEQDLPMDKALETSLLNVYTEVICFYARAIQFFRSHPNILLRRHSWNDFESDFGQTVKRIRRMSSAVESEADLARMRLESAKYREVLDLMKDLKESNLDGDQDIVQCYHVPQSASSQFWGRDTALDAVKSALLPGKKGAGLKTFALYGMGGVGKTQIALQFAEQNREFFDSVLWLRADTVVGMGQSTRDLVQALGLVKNDEDLKDSSGQILKLKTWLRNTNGQWLLVLDNADDAELLNQLLSLDASSATNQASATAIVEMLGGLPLALNQIASFVSQRKMSLDDFLPMYKRHSEKIDAKKSRLTQYEHTLSTVWDMSLSKLSGPSAHLQKLMAFFHPDGIYEKMLCEGSTLVSDNDMGIFADDMELSDAEEVLLQMALIEKNVDEKTLSAHRLIQSAVLRRLSEDGRTKYFDAVVQILHYGFGDSWEEEGGYLFKAWKEDVWVRQEACLPHVVHLVELAERYKLRVGNLQTYGTMLHRCTSYLYQKEYFDVALNLLQVALSCLEDKDSLAFAKAITLKGQIELNLHEPGKALESFRNSLRLYEGLLAANDARIAWAYNNLGMAYTELSDFDKALTCHEKAVEIRLQNNVERIGNSYSNMSALYLRMGEVTKAEEYLYACPALKNFTDETFLNTNNPRFAGDMVLLSRIRRSQGRAEDAMRIATKALAFRRRLLGNRLTTCDAQYHAADILQYHGNIGPSITMLEELVTIAESLPGGEGQSARANRKLSVLYSKLDRNSESKACLQRAIALRAKLRPAEDNDSFEEESFMQLCPWMLW